MGIRHTLARRWLVLAAIGIVAAAGCGRGDTGDTGDTGNTADVPGITDDTITVGATAPLSGPASANGTAAMGGVQAYLEAVNAQGGVELADGKKREIEFVYYDDGYDPSKAVQNYQRLVNQDNVFALLATFGTAPNIAIMNQVNQDQVPQVFVHTGAATFSNDQQANPWTIGWQPTYEAEGEAYGQYLAERDEELTVAVLRQNDDLGKAYVSGFEQGISGSDVRIVARQTYESTAPTVDSQMTNLAQSDADVVFLAISIPKLMANALVNIRQSDWDPTPLLISLSSSLGQVIEPADMTGADNLYSTAFVKGADDPQWQSDTDVQQYLSRMEKYSPDADPRIPNAEWGYGSAATFVTALRQMETVSRQGLMEAIDNLQGGDVPLLLPGVTLDGSAQTEPVIHGFRIQRFRDGKWNLLEAVE